MHEQPIGPKVPLRRQQEEPKQRPTNLHHYTMEHEIMVPCTNTCKVNCPIPIVPNLEQPPVCVLKEIWCVDVHSVTYFKLFIVLDHIVLFSVTGVHMSRKRKDLHFWDRVKFYVVVKVVFKSIKKRGWIVGRPEVGDSWPTDIRVSLAQKHVAVKHMPAVSDRKPSSRLYFSFEMQDSGLGVLPESHGRVHAIGWLSLFSWELDPGEVWACCDDDWLNLDRSRELLHLDFLFVHFKVRFRLLTK